MPDEKQVIDTAPVTKNGDKPTNDGVESVDRDDSGKKQTSHNVEARKKDRKVNYKTADERRLAEGSPDVPGAGGIVITKHKEVVLPNGMKIENF